MSCEINKYKKCFDDLAVFIDKHYMGKTIKITQEDANANVIKRCCEINCTLTSNFEYLNVRKTRLKLHCNIDNYEWETSYASFINLKSKCPKCSNCAKKSYSEFLEKIKNRCNEREYTLLNIPLKMNTNCKILLKCNKDNHEWYVTYNNFIRNGRGCSKCAKKLKPTQNEFIEMLLNRCNELDYKLLETPKYENSKTKIHLKCNKDNHEWYVTYNSFINHNSGCLKCAGNLKITQDDANILIKNKCEKNNYILIEPFLHKNNQSKIHLRCNKDSHEWFMSYRNFINLDRGCPKCGEIKSHLKQRKSKVDVIINIENRCKESNYTLIEPFDYTGNTTPIKLRCNIDGHVWNVDYKSFIRGNGCPKCSKRAKPSQEDANNIIKNICIKKNYILNKEFTYNTASKTYLDLHCNIHNYDWETSYVSFVNQNSGCPLCGQKFNLLEQRIKEILIQNKFNFIHNYKNKDWFGKQSIDFYFPEYKIGVEHQGEQHFIPSKFFGGRKAYIENVKRDKNKYELCKKHGIKLFYLSLIKKDIIPDKYFDKIYTNVNTLIIDINKFIEENHTY